MIYDGRLFAVRMRFRCVIIQVFRVSNFSIRVVIGLRVTTGPSIQDDPTDVSAERVKDARDALSLFPSNDVRQGNIPSHDQLVRDVAPLPNVNVNRKCGNFGVRFVFPRGTMDLPICASDARREVFHSNPIRDTTFIRHVYEQPSKRVKIKDSRERHQHARDGVSAYLVRINYLHVTRRASYWDRYR